MRHSLPPYTWAEAEQIAAVDAIAAQSGLYPGMSVAQAQALAPELTVVEARPEDDTAALRRLAGWCLRYAPLCCRAAGWRVDRRSVAAHAERRGNQAAARSGQ